MAQNEKSPTTGLNQITGKEQQQYTENFDISKVEKFFDADYQPFDPEKCVDVTKAIGFDMSFDYEIKHTTPAVTLNDQPLIYIGEIMTVVALPGTGKSRLCEVLASRFIAKKQNIPLSYDSWGFDINSIQRKAAIFDTERPLDDSRRAIERIYKRTGRNPAALEGSKFKDVDFICLADVDSVKALKTAVENRLEGGEYSFAIIDGILDFCLDGMTDGVDSTAVVKWLRALANKYEMAIVTTLHPNKGTETMAGHIGAYLYRYSRACLLLTRHPHDQETKVITRNFPQGKASHAGDLQDVFYRYDVDAGLHVLCEEPEEIKTIYKGATIEDIFRQHILTTGSDTMPAAQLRTTYAQRVGISERTSSNHIKMAVADGLLAKGGSTKDAAYALQK